MFEYTGSRELNTDAGLRMSDFPTIGDLRSRELAQRLRQSATTVREPQLSRIKRRIPETVFVSHSSADDASIKGVDESMLAPQPDSIWSIVGDKFPDPFYHSLKTGGADAYERIVGLALLVSRRVLIVWSQNALRSDYVRAEVLLATAGDKKVAAYVMPNAPGFPIAGVELLQDRNSLANLLECWKKDVRALPLVLR